MASVLLINDTSEGVPLILRIAQEGHIAKMHSALKTNVLNGYKNPTKLGSMTLIDQFDMIIASGFSESVADRSEIAKAKGLPVLGGGGLTYKLAKDKEYWNTLVNKLYKYNTCNGQDGIGLVIGGWYFKMSGFTHPYYASPYKRFMEGHKGQWLESMGCVVWLAKDDDRLVEEVFKPILPLLDKVNYQGPITIHLTVAENNIFIGKIKPRFEYDIIQAYTELIKGTLFDFLWSLKEGRVQDIALLNQYGVSVRVSLPLYPYLNDWDSSPFTGKKFLGLSDGARKHFFLSDVMMNGDGELLAGVDGNLGCATARGISIHEIRSRVYRTIENTIGAPEVQYRLDIGSGVEEKIDQCKTWGWMNA